MGVLLPQDSIFFLYGDNLPLVGFALPFCYVQFRSVIRQLSLQTLDSVLQF